MFYTAEHVNRYASGELDMEELIYFSESRLTLQFEMLLSEIHVADVNCTESLTDIVLVTGPSSSGKTTLLPPPKIYLFKFNLNNFLKSSILSGSI